MDHHHVMDHHHLIMDRHHHIMDLVIRLPIGKNNKERELFIMLLLRVMKWLQIPFNKENNLTSVFGKFKINSYKNKEQLSKRISLILLILLIKNNYYFPFLVMISFLIWKYDYAVGGNFIFLKMIWYCSEMNKVINQLFWQFNIHFKIILY